MSHGKEKEPFVKQWRLLLTLSDALAAMFPFATPLQAAVASMGGILVAIVLAWKAMPPMLPYRSPRPSDVWRVALIILGGLVAAWSVANMVLALHLI